jgi:hypothetical protein
MRSRMVSRTALAVVLGAASVAGSGVPARAQDVSPRYSGDERVEEGRSARLQRERRYAQDRYRQDYRYRLREQRRERDAWQPYDLARDAYFDAPASVRYAYDGRWYDTNAYGADTLRDAANNGYEEGFRSGEADREDGWNRGGYRDSFAYQDADQREGARTLDPSQRAHFYREGVHRGYDDGFNDRRRYGRTDDGHYLLLAGVLAGLLTFESLR